MPDTGSDRNVQKGKTDFYNIKDIFPVKRKSIPMLREIRNGKLIFDEKPCTYYDIDDSKTTGGAL